MEKFKSSAVNPGSNNTIILTTVEWKNLLNYLHTITESINAFEKRLTDVEETNADMKKDLKIIAEALGAVYDEA